MLQCIKECLVIAQVLKLVHLSLRSVPMLTVDQITTAHKNNLDVFFGMSEKAFAGVEKLVELNLAAAKSAISESVHQAHTLISIKDPQEIASLQTTMVQPMAEKAVAYGRHVYEIASSTSAEIGKTMEAQASEAQHGMMSFIDSTTKNAPNGSEAFVAMFKSAMTAGQNAVETVQKAVKQVSETAEANLQAVAATTMSNAQVATKAAAKKRA
jgi:phasin family protein